MATMGEAVRAEREARGLSQTDLAERAGIARPHLSNIERGTIALPNADLRRRLAEALGMRHVDLLVAAGELTADEVSGVAPAWPDGEARCSLHRLVRALPEASLGYATETLTLIRDARQWTGRHRTPP